MADSRANDDDATPNSSGTRTRHDGNPRGLRAVRVNAGSLRAYGIARKGARGCLVREGTKVSSEHGTTYKTNPPGSRRCSSDMITQACDRQQLRPVTLTCICVVPCANLSAQCSIPPGEAMRGSGSRASGLPETVGQYKLRDFIPFAFQHLATLSPNGVAP